MLSRRNAVSLSLAFASWGLRPAGATPLPPLAMVMNSGEASVSVIDMQTRQVIKTTPTLREPSHWALSLDRSKLYIADANGNSLFILNPLTGDALGFTRMADPYQLGFTPDRKYLVVNALRLNHIDIYDAESLALVKRLQAGAMPSHLDFSPDGRWSFNSCQGSNTLVAIDLTSLSLRWRVNIGPTPAGVLWLNGKVLACIMGSDHLVEVDPASSEITRKVVTGTGPHNLFLSPDRSILYVSNRIGGSVAALDAKTLALQRTYELPGGPDDMGIAPDGKLWIALRFREKVAVMDPGTGAYETIDVGRSPHGIFLNTELAKSGKVTAEIL
jgi:YVTN family beta-propeller protein